MIERIARIKLQSLAASFKAGVLTSARQTGKTTLVKETFSQKQYVSLENPDTRNFAPEDPICFLKMYPHGPFWTKFNEPHKKPDTHSSTRPI